MKILWIIFFLLPISEPRSTPQSPNYIAAVVEYEVNDNVEQNKLAFTQLIAQAAQQNADIVVFPELTLMNSSVSFPVPIHGYLVDYPIPALNPDLYDSLLVSMSKAARDNEIYLVINVRELMDCRNNDTGEYCPEAKEYIFNTNVVFDRQGAVIDRYRKIHLFSEDDHTPALIPDLGIFTTDFGVTFGHFTCFGLIFPFPAIHVVQQHQITDIVFPTMWSSELPYATAVQSQESFAYAMNVNFLGAGANNVGEASTGSGIYSGKAGALISILSGVPTTRLLVATVPKFPGQGHKGPGPVRQNPANFDGLETLTDESLKSHVSKLLSPGLQEIKLSFNDIRCKFIIRMKERNGEKSYKYRAGAFSGTRAIKDHTIGTRDCGVFACTEETIDSCGKRFIPFIDNSTAVFEELIIEATVPIENSEIIDSTFYPSTLDTAFRPLQPNNFDYTVKQVNNVTLHKLSLKDIDAELYTFGLWGRNFLKDNGEITQVSDDSKVVSVEERIKKNRKENENIGATLEKHLEAIPI